MVSSKSDPPDEGQIFVRRPDQVFDLLRKGFRETSVPARCQLLQVLLAQSPFLGRQYLRRFPFPCEAAVTLNLEPWAVGSYRRDATPFVHSYRPGGD